MNNFDGVAEVQFALGGVAYAQGDDLRVLAPGASEFHRTNNPTELIQHTYCSPSKPCVVVVYERVSYLV